MLRHLVLAVMWNLRAFDFQIIFDNIFENFQNQKSKKKEENENEEEKEKEEDEVTVCRIISTYYLLFKSRWSMWHTNSN